MWQIYGVNTNGNFIEFHYFIWWEHWKERNQSLSFSLINFNSVNCNVSIYIETNYLITGVELAGGGGRLPCTFLKTEIVL